MSAGAQYQSRWFIDPVSGNDNNNGDSITPLKMWAELRRRIGAGGLFKQATTITIVNPLPSGDPMLVDFGVDTASNAAVDGLTITGPYADVGATGTVGTARPRAPSTRTFNGITSSTGGFDWTPYVVSDRITTGTGGNINGYRAWVASNDGSALATVSSFVNSSFAEAIIANGDTYKFTQLMRVDSATLRCTRGALVVRGLVFTNTPQFVKTGRAFVQLIECSFEVAVVLQAQASGITFSNCRFQVNNSNCSSDSTTTVLFGGLFINTGNPSTPGTGGGFLFTGGGGSSISAGLLLINTGISVDVGGFVSINDAMWRGGTTDYCGIRVYRHGRLNFVSISGTATAASAPYGMQLDNTAQINFSGVFVLNLIGAVAGTNDVIVGNGNTLTWAQVQTGAWRIDGSPASIGPQT